MAARKGESSLERKFDNIWRNVAIKTWNMPEPEREHVFARPRRFRFDFAWPAYKVAVEMEGGVWTGGGHNRGAGYASNCEKYNIAQIQGWIVLRYVTNDLRERPIQVCEEIAGEIIKRHESATKGANDGE